VTVKQALKPVLLDFIIWCEIIKMNGLIACNNGVLLTFHISHSFFSATEKMKSVILKLKVLGTRIFNHKKIHQHEWYLQGELP